MIDAADPSPDRWATEEIAAVLRIAPATATVRVALARLLAGPLVVTRHALLGRSDHRPARVRSRGGGAASRRRHRDRRAGPRPRCGCRPYGCRVRPTGPSGRPNRRSGRSGAASLCRGRATPRRHHPDDDGMAQLWALLPAVGAATVGAALNALAAQTRHGRGGDARTADQRRADALVTMADAVLADPQAGSPAGPAAGHPGHGGRLHVARRGRQTGRAAGYGPIGAATARRLATGETASWRTLLTDDAGQLVDIGRRSYRPRQVLRDFIVARDRRCTFPGCGQPAARCDLDHVRPYRSGGATDPANLQSLCRRHHRAKHQTEWTPRRRRDGSTVWTSPTGHAYRTKPPPLPPDRLDDS